MFNIHLIAKKAELLIIAIAGVTLAELLKNVNLVLQTAILFVTLATLIIRAYKQFKK